MATHPHVTGDGQPGPRGSRAAIQPMLANAISDQQHQFHYNQLGRPSFLIVYKSSPSVHQFDRFGRQLHDGAPPDLDNDNAKEGIVVDGLTYG